MKVRGFKILKFGFNISETPWECTVLCKDAHQVLDWLFQEIRKERPGSNIRVDETTNVGNLTLIDPAVEADIANHFKDKFESPIKQELESANLKIMELEAEVEKLKEVKGSKRGKLK
jgi:hypothetical protein